MRNITRILCLSFAAVALIASPACGDDDAESTGSGDSTTTGPASGTETTSADDSASTDSGSDSSGADTAFPSAEFCDAVADFASAQDGAQRNQALGDMAEAAGADVPAAVSQALENLDTGDLPAEAYAAAEQALTAVCN